MRYINQDRVLLPPGWQAKATRAYNVVKKLPAAERKIAIKKRNLIWKALKDALLTCSDGKCWYCESVVTATSSGDVDHFRPKNEVENCPAHSGYWWLAFDWKNFRYSCELCNRLSTDLETVSGKTSHFPLWDESRRCYAETDPAGLACEEPLLLDPVAITDPPLLTFDEYGLAIPTCSEEHSTKAYQQARKSIEIYHLNRHRLVNRRKFTVCDKVRQHVTRGNTYYELYLLDNNNEAALVGFKDILSTLQEMISDEAEYSSVARAILKIYIGPGYEWVQEVLISLL